jgi:hypothetical protein
MTPANKACLNLHRLLKTLCTAMRHKRLTPVASDGIRRSVSIPPTGCYRHSFGTPCGRCAPSSQRPLFSDMPRLSAALTTLVSMCCTRPHFASLSGQLTPALLRPLYCRLCDLVSLRWGNGQVTHLASSEEEEAALSLPRGGHLLGIRNRFSIWCIWRSDTCHLGKLDLANYGVVYRLEL